MPFTFPGLTTYVRASIFMIDDSGEKTSLSWRFPAATTALQVITLAENIGNATSANVYGVEFTLVLEAAATKAAALDGEQNSIHDRANVRLANPTGGTPVYLSIPAPRDGVITTMQGDNDVVDTSTGSLVTLAVDALRDIVGTTFTPIASRYVERRKIGKRSAAF